MLQPLNMCCIVSMGELHPPCFVGKLHRDSLAELAEDAVDDLKTSWPPDSSVWAQTVRQSGTSGEAVSPAIAKKPMTPSISWCQAMLLFCETGQHVLTTNSLRLEPVIPAHEEQKMLPGFTLFLIRPAACTHQGLH